MGGGGVDHAIFDDCCFLVLNYSSHVIHSEGLVIHILVIYFQTFKFLRYFFHRYFLLNPLTQSFVIIYIFTCHIVFSVFKICNVLK